MKHKDFYSSLFFLSLGIAVCKGGWDLGLGQLGEPGSGFLPFLMGLLISGLSIVLFGQSIKTSEKRVTSLLFSQIIRKTRRIIIALLLLCLYIPLMHFLGFLFSTFVFILLMMRFVEPQPWKAALLMAILVPGCSYLIFNVLFEIQLPGGFLGFW